MRRQRLRWLGLTAEPERDLPHTLAVLQARGTPSGEAVREQRRLAERSVLHGTERSWLRYLDDAALQVPAAPPADPVVRAAAVVVAEVVLNHHRLLAGFPGPAYDDAALERRRMRAFLAEVHAEDRAQGGAT
ncbi:hypothetical protein EDD99_0553 [Streptomyces sp. 846.5]|nr:hypothetical protein [Streptomyces sp. 846.5]TDU02164.1 hypothetical protein EDD99_0553 [Streptomyces sp. 846.5]